MSVTSSRPHSSINSSSIADQSKGLNAKLRRLKMQEKLLFNSIDVKVDFDYLEPQLGDSLKRDILLIKLRKSYEEIKYLYDDVKDITSSKEMNNIDVDQVKKDVLSLESKIINLKGFLHTEIKTLKLKEDQLMHEILENNSVKELKQKKVINKIKSFNDIVPSPVKNIINTPHKYTEVQKLQDFLKNNGGKYGGWFEYNHNLFVQTRQKYIDGIHHDETEYESSLELFVEDLLLRIIGISEQKIREHEKWYLQYLELKNSQQAALNKWKQSRIHVRSAHHINKQDTNLVIKHIRRTSSAKQINKVTNSLNDEPCEYITDYLSTIVNEGFENRDNENEQNTTLMRHTKSFMKPTQVWNNRCISMDQLNSTQNKIIVENIPKYGIPKWRRNMLNN